MLLFLSSFDILLMLCREQAQFSNLSCNEAVGKTFVVVFCFNVDQVEIWFLQVFSGHYVGNSQRTWENYCKFDGNFGIFL